MFTVPSGSGLLPVVLDLDHALPVIAAPTIYQADRHPALVYLASLGPATVRTRTVWNSTSWPPR